MIVVADSSPLISLAILDKLDFLGELFEEVFIPKAVFIEITETGKPFSDILHRFSVTKIKKVKNKVALSILADELDIGESEAIILALENSISDILMDEHKGRRIARAKELHPIGTIGILIQAKNNGLVEAIKPLLNKLVENNIYISPRLYKHALELAKE